MISEYAREQKAGGGRADQTIAGQKKGCMAAWQQQHAGHISLGNSLINGAPTRSSAACVMSIRSACHLVLLKNGVRGEILCYLCLSKGVLGTVYGSFDSGTFVFFCPVGSTLPLFSKQACTVELHAIRAFARRSVC